MEMCIRDRGTGDEDCPEALLAGMDTALADFVVPAAAVLPEEENPLALKSDFVLSFCELIMGSKTGLEAIEKTVIDRAVQKIYQPYFADPRPENMRCV